MKPEEIIAQARRSGRSALDEVAAKRLLTSFAIPIPRSVIARDAADVAEKARSLTAPLVAKVISPDILHKSDAGGVQLDLADVDAVCAAIERMTALPGIKAARIDGWLVEEMGPKGQEIVIGAIRDPQFGPLVMVGFGGIFVEIIKDVSFRICPIEERDARAMLAELKAAVLFEGVRGRKHLDKEAVVDALLKVGGRDGLMMQLDAVVELDINPVIVGEQGLIAVDARLILADPATPSPITHAPAKPYDELPILDRFRPLFEPKTVAVLGASAKGGNALANTFIRRMKNFGYRGEIYPIHPQATVIELLPAYPSLATTPNPVDYAFVALGAERIPAAARRSARPCSLRAGHL